MSVRVSIRMHFPISVRLSDVIRDERERESAVSWTPARPTYAATCLTMMTPCGEGAATQESTQDIAG